MYSGNELSVMKAWMVPWIQTWQYWPLEILGFQLNGNISVFEWFLVRKIPANESPYKSAYYDAQDTQDVIYRESMFCVCVQFRPNVIIGIIYLIRAYDFEENVPWQEKDPELTPKGKMIQGMRFNLWLNSALSIRMDYWLLCTSFHL